MKNKIILFFLVTNLSMVTAPIFAVWDDIFSWAKHRTIEMPVASDVVQENNEQRVAIEQPKKEVQKIPVNTVNNKAKDKQNWDPKKVTAVVGILALTCFFNIKVMFGMIVLAYLVRQNAQYINESGAGKIIDGFVEKSMQTIKEIL